MYVGTLSVRSGEVLVRVDVECRGSNNIGKYTLTQDSGEVLDAETTLGPDVDGVGVPIIAVIHLLREMSFCYDDGPVELVQPSRVFNDDSMALVLDCTRVARTIQSLATAATVQ